MFGKDASAIARWCFNVSLVITLTGCFGKAPDQWGTYQGNKSHNGYVNSTVTPANFQQRWVFEYTSSSSQASAITTDNDHVFLSRGKQLMAIDLFDHSISWAKDFSSRDSLNPPAVADGKVYVQTGGPENSFLWAYQADSGEFVFQSQYGNQGSRYLAPTIDDGTVYVTGGYYGGMYAFDADSGTESWYFGDNDLDGSTPTVSGDYVLSYTDDNDPRLSVLNKETGEELFGIADPNYDWRGWSLGSALVAGGADSVILRQSNRLVSFDLKTQSIDWELIEGFTGQPSVAKGVVYAINHGHLEARRESTGALLWVWSAEQGGVSGTMPVLNNLLFVRQSNATHAIDLKTHESVWSYPVVGELAVSDGTLFISGTDKLVAIDLVGDTDNDGLPQYWEKEYGGDIDPATDEDSDGLTALAEYEQGTNPTLSDTDGDGLSDGDEVHLHSTDPLKIDTDGDSLSDGDEVAETGTSPIASDTDGDGITDDLEIAVSLNPTNADDAAQDTDGDSFSNLVEAYAGSDLRDFSSVPVLAWHMYQANAGHNGYFPMELDEQDFSVRWEYSAETNLNPAVNAGGLVFISSDSYFNTQYLKALNAYTGDVVWSTSFAGIDYSAVQSVSGPSVSAGNVYVHTGDHEDTAVRGFTMETGELQVMGNHAAQWPNYLQPTFYQGDAYVEGGYYGGMLKINGESGNELWFTSLATARGVEPAVGHDRVFAVTGNGFSAFDVDSGELDFTVEGSVQAQTLVLGSRGNVLVSGGQLISYDIDSQIQNWSTSMEGQSFGLPAIGNGKVFAVSGNNLFAFSEASGQSLWQWPAGERLTSNVVVTASHVFVGTANVTYALDINSGEKVWQTVKGGHLSMGEDGLLLIVGSSLITAMNVEGDSDNDGMPNWWERRYGFDVDNPADGMEDADNDGLSNSDEFAAQTQPHNSDSDEDGLSDADEVLVYVTNPNQADTDADGLTDTAEVIQYGTDPNNGDTDGDGIFDNDEVATGLNPLGSEDALSDNDDDGFPNLVEVYSGSDLNDSQSVPSASWGMFQGNASHNGYVPIMLDVGEFGFNWTVTLDRAVQGVVMHDGLVYTTHSVYHGYSDLVALNAGDGSEAWRTPARPALLMIGCMYTPVDMRTQHSGRLIKALVTCCSALPTVHSGHATRPPRFLVKMLL